MVEEEVGGGGVAGAAESGDLADAGGRDDGAAAEGLAGVDVGEVHLDGGEGDRFKGVVEGDRGVGVGACVEDDARWRGGGARGGSR